MIITNDMMVHKALSDKIDGYKNCDVVKRNQLKEKWLHDVNFNLVFIKHRPMKNHSATKQKGTDEIMKQNNKITLSSFYSFLFIGSSHESILKASFDKFYFRRLNIDSN